MSDTAGASAQDNPGRAPWGHSIAAHALFGGCAHCLSWSWESEALAWRTWATVRGVLAWPRQPRQPRPLDAP